MWLAIHIGLASMPRGTTWQQLYGVSLLCGIGFTMSLFIGSLAFEHSDFDAPIRLGVLTGSLLSAVGGYLLLAFGPRGTTSDYDEAAPTHPYESHVRVEPRLDPRL
jgi:NhaA family Na+:H+ antiporter